MAVERPAKKLEFKKWISRVAKYELILTALATSLYLLAKEKQKKCEVTINGIVDIVRLKYSICRAE